MPISPGLPRPQYYQELKIHGFESPWGGKFHVTQERQKDGKSINYLNLFEVAKKMDSSKNSVNKS